jgi:hypothetical protein
LIARSPIAPSLPAPDSTTQTARSCWSAARDWKKSLINPYRRAPSIAVSRSLPFTTVSARSGGIT